MLIFFFISVLDSAYVTYQATSRVSYFHSPPILICFWCHLQYLRSRENIRLLPFSERNLGRDNRIVSDHGVAGRYPFLDEGVVSYLNGLCLGRLFFRHFYD